MLRASFFVVSSESVAMVVDSAPRFSPRTPRPEARLKLMSMEECAVAVTPVPEVQHVISPAVLSEARELMPALVCMGDNHLSTLLALRAEPVGDIVKASAAYASLLERLKLGKLHIDNRSGTILAVDDVTAPAGYQRRLALRACAPRPLNFLSLSVCVSS